MATNADAITVEWDEDGLHLRVVADDGDHDFRVADPEQLYTESVGAIEGWLDERDAAKASMPPRDDGEGYALDDPKHPTYHDRMSGLHDNRSGK